MLVRNGFRAWCPLIIALASLGFAADVAPVAGPGATREEVLATYGRPTGQSKMGTKEVISYPQGQVTLDNGQVDRVTFSTTRAGARAVEASLDAWLTHYDEAVADAGRRNLPILALFSGGDWSAASRLFLDEVAPNPEFVKTFGPRFVLLRVEFPMRGPALPANVREQNYALRQRYGVTLYPTLLILGPTGEKRATIDLAALPPGESYFSRVAAAIQRATDVLATRELAPGAPPATTPKMAEAPTEVTSGLETAKWVVIRGVAAGILIAAVLFWIVWRVRPGVKAALRRPAADPYKMGSTRSPWSVDMKEWPREKLCAVVAALAETEGHLAQVQPATNGPDIVLKRRGEAHPRALVCCVPGTEVIAVRRVREFVTMLAGEGVSVGWFAAPAGFVAEARTYAEQRGVVLIDQEQLQRQLQELPPLMQNKVLERSA